MQVESTKREDSKRESVVCGWIQNGTFGEVHVALSESYWGKHSVAT